jgi:serine/threonine protein kinase
MVASAPQSFAHDLLIGKPIAGRYRVVRLLGEGGMGAVYEARPIDGSATVAIKVLAAQYAVDDVSARRFMQEAEAAARIAHPNIAYVTQMGREPSGALYIVQELLRGEDARAILQRRGTLSLGEAAAIVLPIASALDAAHKHGILHRDVKPENIFVTITPDGAVPKLIDFGISKFQDAQLENDKRTQTGVAIGTPDYMSPEQARADRALDGRTDQWSLATVLYELLTARPPYVAPTATLVLTKIITEQPPRIELFMPDIPSSVAAVIHRALDTNRDKRFASMAAFAEALSSALRDAGVAVELPEVLIPGEDEPVRRRARNASAEVRTPGLPKAPTTNESTGETPTTLLTAPPSAPTAPHHSPLSAPPIVATIGAHTPSPMPSVILDDSAFVDPKRSNKIVLAIAFALLAAAIAAGGWYAVARKPDAIASTSAPRANASNTAQPAPPPVSPQTQRPEPDTREAAPEPSLTTPDAATGTSGTTPRASHRRRNNSHVRSNNTPPGGLTIRREYREQ